MRNGHAARSISAQKRSQQRISGRVISDLVEFSSNKILSVDICIVGAGAAGITLAQKLVDRGIDVLLLESGGFTPQANTQQLYAGEVCDERLHSPPDRYRQRRFGGSTTIWGGRCMPYDAIDFEHREYVPHSGWPFGLDTLLRYYPEANRLCEAGRFAYHSADAFANPLPPLLAGFDSQEFSTDTLERFSCPTDFGRRYRTKLATAPNVRVLLHSNVTSIRLDANAGRVTELTASDLAGNHLTVRARRYVLAAGGMETARLLLSNRDVQPNGIGNDRDVVGRYYMCHIAGTIGRIEAPGPLSNVNYGYNISEEGIYCRRRIAMRAATQRAQRLGNFVARLHHPRIADPAHRNAVLSSLYLAKFLIPYEYGKRLVDDNALTFGGWMRHVANVATAPHDAVGFAWHMLRDRKLAPRKFPSIIIRPKRNLYSLDFHAEQQPNPASRLLLSERTDALGVPQLKIDWRYTEGDVDTVTRSLALLAQEMSRSGAASFDYDADSVEAEMTRYGAYGGHHIGTARLGSDPRTSVVDPDCLVHGLDNLYVAGAAVFPTSSQANPTLTIVAMTLRLADHLLATQAAAS
jgi:choline dehydrogenase-like flavoprotein